MSTLENRPHTALLVIDVQNAPGRTAGTVSTKDVDFGRG